MNKYKHFRGRRQRAEKWLSELRKVKLLKSPDTISEVIKIKPNLVSRESVKVLNR